MPAKAAAETKAAEDRVAAEKAKEAALKNQGSSAGKAARARRAEAYRENAFAAKTPHQLCRRERKKRETKPDAKIAALPDPHRCRQRRPALQNRYRPSAPGRLLTGSANGEWNGVAAVAGAI